ncbi:hypothetical protein ACIBI9_65405 [Nonomuraea sp. NPDC050451]|uniref:hypothetical protein n=1 Tax=Nonomuraea sp. NPDC050451 TaxID=3364364 RepID=UPI0037A6810F
MTTWKSPPTPAWNYTAVASTILLPPDDHLASVGSLSDADLPDGLVVAEDGVALATRWIVHGDEDVKVEAGAWTSTTDCWNAAWRSIPSWMPSSHLHTQDLGPYRPRSAARRRCYDPPSVDGLSGPTYARALLVLRDERRLGFLNGPISHNGPMEAAAGGDLAWLARREGGGSLPLGDANVGANS